MNNNQPGNPSPGLLCLAGCGQVVGLFSNLCPECRATADSLADFLKFPGEPIERFYERTMAPAPDRHTIEYTDDELRRRQGVNGSRPCPYCLAQPGAKHAVNCPGGPS